MAPDVVIYYVPGCNLEPLSPICLAKFIPTMTCLALVPRIGLGGTCPKMMRTNLELSREGTVHGVSAQSTAATTRAEGLTGLVEVRVVAAGRDGLHSSMGCGQKDFDTDALSVAATADAVTRGRASFIAARSTEDGVSVSSTVVTSASKRIPNWRFASDASCVYWLQRESRSWSSFTCGRST